ncbi:MAG TPA: RDD family protein [Flavisolibacter sp.]|jgi:uncharacterized RDD family membrane protein YckC
MEHYNQPTDLFLDEPVIYGGFWERFGAAFLDGLILIIPYYAIFYLLPGGINDIVSIVMYWLYFALQESSASQATIGKKALGLKVTSVEGGRITFGQATGRYFGHIISSIILLIGYFMMLWDDKNQTLHDKMAGTLVVKS